MNILFLMKVFEVGGQEKVTAILAECFANHGHNVTIASFATPMGLIAENLDKRIRLVDLHSEFKCNDKVVVDVRKLLIDELIDIVINQWGLPFVPAKVLDMAIHAPYHTMSPLATKPKLKTVAIYHNDPESNARIKDVEIALEGCKNPLIQLVLQFKKWLFKQVTARSMRYVYNHSDQYQVLSPSYIVGFKKFTGLKCTDHLISLANPVTIESSDFQYDFNNKQKEVIYCGRIDYNQKRVFRLIDSWALIEKDFPEWKLTIVGDGVSRKEVEEQVKTYGLNKVQFEGFQQPLEYYKRASILALASEYEGFPLVLAECMSLGVVPVVYDSFSAVHDIISDGVNGAIVPKVNGEFNRDRFAEKLRSIMNDDILRDLMAYQAIKTSKNYSIDNIYKEWESVFKKLCKNYKSNY